MDFTADTLMLGIAWYVVFLFSLTIHEAAHAWAAMKLGDPTAYLGGQVTLNPIPHVRREPFGTILLPILSFAFYGWMMGWASAPYNPEWARNFPKRAGLMALAGPVANLIAAVAAGIGIRVGMAQGIFRMPISGEFGIDQLVMPVEPGIASGAAVLLSVLFSLNFLLFLFNLLPLPPLDGASVLQALLPTDLARKYREIAYQPMYALLGLIVAWRLFGMLFWPIFGVVLSLLYI